MTVKLDLVVNVGSCNNCQQRNDPLVLLVDMRTMTFRLCSVCAAEMVTKFMQHLRAEPETAP